MISDTQLLRKQKMDLDRTFFVFWRQFSPERSVLVSTPVTQLPGTQTRP